MFRLVKILNGRINQGEPVRLPSKPSTTYSFGQALSLSGGMLVSATGKPDFICCEDYSAPASDNRDVLVEPVSADMVFEAPFSAAPTSVNVGDKVKLASDGLQLSSDTTSGVATIFDKCGATNAGDKCLVQFK